MKVGIDARCLSKELTGIGYYCLHIIKELKKFDVDLILFSPKPLSVPGDILQNISIVQGNCRWNINDHIWSQVYLPFLIQRYNLDLMWGPSHRLPLLLPKKLVKVLTIHDLIWRRTPETMRKRTWLTESVLMPFNLQKADIILADSLSTAADLETDYPKIAHKIRHVPLGSEHMTSKCLSSIKQKDPAILETTIDTSEKQYVLFVGTIESRKNLTRLLLAYAQLPVALKKEFKLVIVGGKGWGHVNLEKQISELGLQESVALCGYVSEIELLDLYKKAYCLAMPSLYEGFGLPILEAQRFGVPVVTSNNSSMPEVAGDGAILVDPYSVNSISNGLKELLQNNTLRQELSNKAIKNVEKYSWEQTAQQTFCFFKEAMVLKKTLGFNKKNYGVKRSV